MNSTEAILELTQVICEKLTGYNATHIAEDWRGTFKQIDNDDSDVYNSFAILCDMMFYNENRHYFLHDLDNNTYQEIKVQCSLIQDEENPITFPNVVIGNDDHFLFKLLNFLYKQDCLIDIYDEYSDVLERYFDEIRFESFDVVWLSDDEINKPYNEYKAIYRFSDWFDIIKNNKLKQVFDAIMTCVYTFRKLTHM